MDRTELTESLENLRKVLEENKKAQRITERYMVLAQDLVQAQEALDKVKAAIGAVITQIDPLAKTKECSDTFDYKPFLQTHLDDMKLGRPFYRSQIPDLYASWSASQHSYLWQTLKGMKGVETVKEGLRSKLMLR